MVIKGDFKVELVTADKKVTFQEHSNDGKTYVEVEPETEYLIRYQRVASAFGLFLEIKCLVDEKDLGWDVTYKNKTKDRYPRYGGSWSRRKVNEEKIMKHLKFVTPRVFIESPSATGDGNPDTSLHGHPPALMGTIKFLVYREERVEPMSVFGRYNRWSTFSYANHYYPTTYLDDDKSTEDYSDEGDDEEFQIEGQNAEENNVTFFSGSKAEILVNKTTDSKSSILEKKRVRSEEGSTCTVQIDDLSCVNKKKKTKDHQKMSVTAAKLSSSRGYVPLNFNKDKYELKLVDTIVLNYCTVPGLIHVGILPMPPLYEYHRMLANQRTSNTMELIPKAHAPLSRILRIVEERDSSGRVLSREEKYDEVYDLSNLPSSDEGGDDESSPVVASM